MIVASYFELIFLLILSACCTSDYVRRHRRQIPDGTARNVGAQQQKPGGTMPINNYPYNPSNNPNMVVGNVRYDPKQVNNNNPPFVVSQPQMGQAGNPGVYNNPTYQQSPFTGEKPSGWFGTNHNNWISNRESELDKQKLAVATNPLNSPQMNFAPPQRADGGLAFLAKVAKQYASKGEKAFKFGQFETRQGIGAVCSNHENFDGYIFGTFACPLPASTGMNQLDQYCCGYPNYQYCCNAQEFSQTQRGAYVDPRFIDQQRAPKQSNYPSSMKQKLAIIIPIVSFIIVAGSAVLVFLYYKKFRSEQHRSRKPAGAIRLEDSYSIIPQDSSIEKAILDQDDE